MTAPVLVVHRRAPWMAERLATLCPGERFVPIDHADAPDLAGAFELAFTINDGTLSSQVYAELARRPTLNWMHVGGSGVDHLGRWREGLVVTNSVGILSPFLAQTCFGALLTLTHRFFDYRDQQQARQWRPLTFRPLAGQTIVIVGFGAIGQALGRLCRAAGMRVIGLRRRQGDHPDADEIRPPSALLDSLAEADVISSHLRLTEETRHIFDATAFAAMKPGAIFMNTGRGGLVDEGALIDALDGPIAQAYLDVTEVEPLPQDSPLWQHPQLLLTPHASDNTIDFEERFAQFYATQLQRYRAGTPLENVVARP